MKRMAVVLTAAFALSMLAGSSLQAGAKDGKMRWSYKKTGKCKTLPPIEVPAADLDKKKPGVHVLKIVFKAKQLAEFVLIGDGDSDVDVIVKDSKGKVVAKDVDPPASEGGGSDLCVCRWTPEREEEFTIIIINNDPVTNVVQCACN
jgi:hypothetical protein